MGQSWEMLVKDYLQRCGQGKGINKECWDAEGLAAGRSSCYPESGGKGLGRAWPMMLSESRGLEGALWAPSIGSSNCGGAARIHRRCSFQTCGSSDKEILWPLSLPSTFWLPAAAPGTPPPRRHLTGATNWKPADKGIQQGRESGGRQREPNHHQYFLRLAASYILLT